MKIRELIEKLSLFDQDLIVDVEYISECPICTEELNADYEIFGVKKVAAGRVVIEL